MNTSSQIIDCLSWIATGSLATCLVIILLMRERLEKLLRPDRYAKETFWQKVGEYFIFAVLFTDVGMYMIMIALRKFNSNLNQSSKTYALDFDREMPKSIKTISVFFTAAFNLFLLCGIGILIIWLSEYFRK